MDTSTAELFRLRQISFPSRAGSIIPEDELFNFGASDNPMRRESTALSVKRRGTSTTYNSKESVYMADATSMEKLSEKVKKSFC